MTHVNPYTPHADNICFDDLWNIPMEQRNLLASRRVVFGTEFRANDKTYAGNIVAPSWEAAERIAFGRGLGEEIVGRLVETGDVHD